jgi:mannose-6-phosphate isomerase-like protein (cupin superfamily)
VNERLKLEHLKLDQKMDMKASILRAQALPGEPDCLAPDGSEIRLLPVLKGGSMSHCTLQPGQISTAVVHRTVEEIWYVLSGRGEIRRRFQDRLETTSLQAGVSLTIPLGAEFQFRNIGSEPLCLIIATMPPWPGSEEAIAVPSLW